jgi:hypothetical protein
MGPAFSNVWAMSFLAYGVKLSPFNNLTSFQVLRRAGSFDL